MDRSNILQVFFYTITLKMMNLHPILLIFYRAENGCESNTNLECQAVIKEHFRPAVAWSEKYRTFVFCLGTEIYSVYLFRRVSQRNCFISCNSNIDLQGIFEANFTAAHFPEKMYGSID